MRGSSRLGPIPPSLRSWDAQAKWVYSESVETPVERERVAVGNVILMSMKGIKGGWDGTRNGRTEEGGVDGLEGRESIVESEDLGGADESEVPEKTVSLRG